jgi:hypothetical protein
MRGWIISGLRYDHLSRVKTDPGQAGAVEAVAANPSLALPEFVTSNRTSAAPAPNARHGKTHDQDT